MTNALSFQDTGTAGCGVIKLEDQWILTFMQFLLIIPQFDGDFVGTVITRVVYVFGEESL